MRKVLIVLAVLVVAALTISATANGESQDTSPAPHLQDSTTSSASTSSYDGLLTAQAYAEDQWEAGFYSWLDTTAQSIVAYAASLYVPPAPVVVESAGVPASTTVTSNSNPGDFLSCVRNRESGGNYGIYNSGGSGAAGAYQFMPGTWNSIAASSGRSDLVGVSPAQAAPSDQDAMAQALYAQQGAAPWGGGC